MSREDVELRRRGGEPTRSVRFCAQDGPDAVEVDQVGVAAL